MSIYDLQNWMGSPSIYVYDCSNAGMILKCFGQFAEQHAKEDSVYIILFCYYSVSFYYYYYYLLIISLELNFEIKII